MLQRNVFWICLSCSVCISHANKDTHRGTHLWCNELWMFASQWQRHCQAEVRGQGPPWYSCCLPHCHPPSKHPCRPSCMLSMLNRCSAIASIPPNECHHKLCWSPHAYKICGTTVHWLTFGFYKALESIGIPQERRPIAIKISCLNHKLWNILKIGLQMIYQGRSCPQASDTSAVYTITVHVTVHWALLTLLLF